MNVEKQYPGFYITHNLSKYLLKAGGGVINFS
jgi:hypothetical protein